MDLFEKSLMSLEWQSLLAHYSEHCLSAPAKLRAETLALPKRRAESEALIELTEEAMKLLSEDSFSYFADLGTLEAALLRLQKSAVLDGKDLIGIARLIQIVENLESHFQKRKFKPGDECLGVSGIVSALHIHKTQRLAIQSALDGDGQVKDSASPRLRSLKDQERRLHSEARERLDSVLQKAFRDGYLQERFFDLRDGRYLIPVKTEFRNKIAGSVVESSSTKASVFIEPAAVRECNDKIKEVQLEIQEEIYRILEELSKSLAPVARELYGNYAHVVELDLTFGRGRFARFYADTKGAAKPRFGNSVSLDGLYHPLLPYVIDKDKIVRNDFRLDASSRVLVISGPNTGGKTVLLKSVGLSALLARAGFFLSCEGQAEIPFFTEVLAQIGDAQNLELSLSSFSGSIIGLKEILDHAGPGTLVLVDEILHATDPDEASALSRAILSDLQKRGATAIVTTHLNGLKVADGKGAKFLNASMEFDTKELLPTYRLRLGVPGSSRALEIGERLGLPRALVEHARGFLLAGIGSLQDRIDTLESKERELFREKESTRLLQEQLGAEHEKSRKLQAELENQKRTFKASALESLRSAERAAVQELESLIEDYKGKLKEVGERHQASVEAKARIEKIRERYKTAAESLEKALPNVEILPKVPAEEHEEERPLFKMNGRVFVQTMKSNGILLSDPSDRRKPAEVMVGNMKLRVDWEKLKPLGGERAQQAKNRNVYTESVSCAPELNLIGKTGDEARDELELYLDKAFRSGRPSVRIIHGFGSGALKRAVRDVLQQSSYDIKVRPGTSSEGGDGCTVVEFHH